MTKIKKSSEILWVLGIICVAIGVSICSKANLGVSMIAAPAFVLSEAISSVFPSFSVGVAEYVLQGLLLLILCIIIRSFRWKYLLAFAVAILYGYTLNFFIWAFSCFSFNAVWLRYVMLFVGDLFTAFGVACFFRTYLPLAVYELFVAELSARFKLNLRSVKWAFDISLLVISIVIALVLFGDVTTFDWSTITHCSFHSIGLGTIITTLINSPIISFMGKLIDKIFDATPMFPSIEQRINGK